MESGSWDTWGASSPVHYTECLGKFSPFSAAEIYWQQNAYYYISIFLIIVSIYIDGKLQMESVE